MLIKFLSLLLISAYGTLLAMGFTNPIKSRDGSDPFMVYHEGYYYLTTTTWTNIQLTRSTTISGLKTASPKVVWTDSTSTRCCNMWAPEIHWQATEAAWFIYYTAGHSANLDNQRIHVLRGSSNIIWDSKWSYAGRVAIPNRDVWSIDASILIAGSAQTRYLVYSSWDGDQQCLYIARMNSATTVGNSVKIASPTLSWEREGGNVNEGPIALYRNGRTFLIYSASFCAGTGYKLGRLELKAGADPLLPASWSKYGSPVFSAGNSQFQPGHNGFFFSPSGNQVWNVYHANTNTPGLCDGSRYTAIQQVNFASDGTPNFGTPRPLSENIAEPV